MLPFNKGLENGEREQVWLNSKVNKFWKDGKAVFEKLDMYRKDENGKNPNLWQMRYKNIKQKEGKLTKGLKTSTKFSKHLKSKKQTRESVDHHSIKRSSCRWWTPHCRETKVIICIGIHYWKNRWDCYRRFCGKLSREYVQYWDYCGRSYDTVDTTNMMVFT